MSKKVKKLRIHLKESYCKYRLNAYFIAHSVSSKLKLSQL